MLDTLAVAYQAAGRPEQARRTAQRALAKARADGNAPLVEEILTRFPAP